MLVHRDGDPHRLSSWSGTLTIAADGTFSGSIQQGAGLPPSCRGSNESNRIDFCFRTGPPCRPPAAGTGRRRHRRCSVRDERRASRGRRATTLLEVQVAFVILGIGLAGLCPLVVMQLRQVRVLELRLQGQVIENEYRREQPMVDQTMLAMPTPTISCRGRTPGRRSWPAAARSCCRPPTPCDPGPLSVRTRTRRSIP